MRIGARPSFRWWLLAGALALVLAGTAAVLGANLGARKPAAPGPAASAAAAPINAAESTAIPWIITNVGAQHVVACDVTVCGLLQAQGFPATSLITVRAGISDVEGADVVVVTPLLRQLTGPGLATVQAPEPLAVFTAGGQSVVVSTVTLLGPTVYAAHLTADRTSRSQAGQALVANPRLNLSPTARAQLTGGMVDTRVCSLLALLVGTHSITVTSFTVTGPGAGPDLPSAGVVIDSIDGRPPSGTGSAAVALHSLLAAQQAPYQPLYIGPVAGAAAPQPANGGAAAGTDSAGLEVLYAQPGPLGLLGGGSQ